MSHYFTNNRLVELLSSPKMALAIHSFVFSRKMPSFVAFSFCYWRLMQKLRESENECKRLAAAGSLMTHCVEMAFYFGDTINSRSKVNQESLSMMRLLNNVLQAEGVNAFAKGINATYYGSVFYGFSYFYTYTSLKVIGHDRFERHNKLPLLYFLSGVVSEYAALLLYFPFETVKVRLQS